MLVVDEHLPGLEVDELSACREQPGRKAWVTARPLPAHQPECIAIRWHVHRKRRLFEFSKRSGRLSDARLLKERLLIVQDTGGDLLGNAKQPLVVTRGVLAAAEEIIPTEVWIALGEGFQQRLMVQEMRRHPTRHLHRPLGDIDAR